MRNLVFLVVLICCSLDALGQNESWEFRRIRQKNGESDTIFITLRITSGKYFLLERFDDEEWIHIIDSAQKQELSLLTRNSEKTYLLSSFSEIGADGWSAPSFQERSMQEGVHYNLFSETKVIPGKLLLQRGEAPENGRTYTIWILPGRQLLLRDPYHVFVNTPAGFVAEMSGGDKGRTMKLEVVSYKENVSFPEETFSLVPPAGYTLFVPKPVEEEELELMSE